MNLKDEYAAKCALQNWFISQDIKPEEALLVCLSYAMLLMLNRPPENRRSLAEALIRDLEKLRGRND